MLPIEHLTSVEKTRFVGGSAPSMKICIDQKHGLGNQLFQYAAGLCLSKRYNAELEIVLERKDRASSHGHPRPFLLSKFKITTPWRERTDWDRLICSVAAHKRPIAALARRLSRCEFYAEHFTLYHEFVPELKLRGSTKTLYINGTFQAHQYASSVEPRLREELEFVERPRGKNAETLARILEDDGAVSVHVRHGDYKVYSGWDSTLPVSYYRNAQRMIESRVRRPTYYIFSDDQEYARRHLGSMERAVYVADNPEAAGHEDLRLMAACRHHIMANSTFSWWGAWLNPRPEKEVVVPDVWMNNKPTDPNMVAPGWTVVPAKEDWTPVPARGPAWRSAAS